jgi:formate C-acetyltransferase
MRDVGCTDDYGIACCVSQLEIGKWMQFFWARCNIAKALLLAINEGKDELSWIQVLDWVEKLESDLLNFDQVWNIYKKVLSHLAQEYVNTMNIIHYMHDKYYYEKAQLAFMDSHIKRLMAFGVAGFSVVVDSLSAIKYAKVKVKRNEQWISEHFEIQGEFPKYGNDNDQVDQIAVDVVKYFIWELRKHKIYRNAEPTLSILTITSNVVYDTKPELLPMEEILENLLLLVLIRCMVEILMEL